MKAYKGFNKDKNGRIYCQPCVDKIFYYDEGKTYECEDAILCKKGFHACTLPIDVFNYYNSDYDSVEYHEVELENISDECGDDSKIVGTKITIGKEITPDEMVDISIKMIMGDKEKYFKEKQVYRIYKDEKCNFLKPDGTYLTEQWFDLVGYFKNRFAIVNLNNKWNWLKEDGTLVWNKPVEQWFDWVSDFYNGFAIVNLNSKYNFLQPDGTLLWDKPIEQWFDFAFNFNNGFTKVQINEKWFKLNEKGELIK